MYNILTLNKISDAGLKHFKPESLGHALRISGVTPVDVQLISVIIARNERQSENNN